MSCGVAITTYNSEDYFSALFESLPDLNYDLVIVNGGEPYKKEYTKKNVRIHWIQHTENLGPARSRNDGLKKLYDLGCEYFFIIEDDMIIKSPDVFGQYIKASRRTGLQYFCFVSYPWGAGPIGNRTPSIQIRYAPDLIINFYTNSCNEFTFRTRQMLEKTGYYDEKFKYCFDVDNYYKITKQDDGHCFWYSCDLSNSDDLVMNNPDAISRLDNDGKRVDRLTPDYQYFKNKHGHLINETPLVTQQQLISKLQYIYNKHGNVQSQ